MITFIMYVIIIFFIFLISHQNYKNRTATNDWSITADDFFFLLKTVFFFSENYFFFFLSLVVLLFLHFIVAQCHTTKSIPNSTSKIGPITSNNVRLVQSFVKYTNEWIIDEIWIKIYHFPKLKSLLMFAVSCRKQLEQKRECCFR